MKTFKTATRYLYGGFFMAAGANHFVHPDFYARVMPPYLPWPGALIGISGAAEMVLGALLLFRRCAAAAGWGLIALLVAVFPVHVHMLARQEDLFPSYSPALLWARLPLQGVFIAWAYWYTRGTEAAAR